METTKLPAIMEYFSEIPDPRKNTNNRKKYPLEEVIVITILAVMSLAKGWEDIERYGKAKREMLSKFLKLEQGIPKHDVYRLVFSKLSPKLVEKCFTDWVRSIKEPLENGIGREITAIDGKTARGSFQVETGKAVHIVSAWATANKLGVRTDKDGRKEQRNHGYTDIAGIHSAGGRHSNDRRDGLPA